ncbi:tail fiber protein [Acinetobacter johnsonii]|uniref:tail fiber protein n=1 Tax=Acinetobacter johnsonii TaxID=40214 RepID=UPI002935A2AD|nr:tail fiber protein [Acinetobacter johnsonii]MDV2488625.1 tail fiber protein [Acinetobacter johnsonii]
MNARPDENGLGKAGFNDNADLPGQDATYVTPGWFNTVQEELCNLLELNGIVLDPTSKRQLYDLLTTQTDLEALAAVIEEAFIRKSQIIDNLTTNDATKPASAKQVKLLQDNKLDKVDLNDATVTQKGIVQLNNTLSSTSTSQALTAGQGKVLNDQAFGVGQTWQPASLVKGTTYTNTSSKPIVVFAYFTQTTVNHMVALYCGEAIIDRLEVWGTGGATNTVKTLSLRGEIPAGASYRFDVDQTSVNIVYSRILS